MFLVDNGKLVKMAKKCIWLHSLLTVPHLLKFNVWVDDMKPWPEVSYIDIINCSEHSEGVDGEELQVFYRKHGDFIFLKAEMPSQAKQAASYLNR